MCSDYSVRRQLFSRAVDGTARIIQKVESDQAKLVINLIVGKMKFNGLEKNKG